MADTLRIVVIDAETGDAIPDVEIRRGGLAVARTDSLGRAALPMSAGEVRLRISRVGYNSREVAFPRDSVPASPLTLQLQSKPVLLPALRARAGAAVRTRALKDFYRRVERGTGRYFTRADIDRARPRDIADLLRTLPSMRVISSEEGDKVEVVGETPQLFRSFRHRSGDCPILYYLDGSPYQPLRDGMIGLDIRPQELEGIEVYRNGAGAPAQYTNGRAVCGVILLWKRERI